MQSCFTIASTVLYSVFKVSVKFTARIEDYSNSSARVKDLTPPPTHYQEHLQPVEEMGLEPTTLGLQSRCSTS